MSEELKPCPLQIGDKVFVVAECLPAHYSEDWRDVEAFVTAIRYAPAMKGGYDVTISEVWPPKSNGDLVDGFDIDSLALLSRTPDGGRDSVVAFNEGMERAAGIAEASLIAFEADGTSYVSGQRNAARSIAAAIRQMKSQQGEG